MLPRKTIIVVAIFVVGCVAGFAVCELVHKIYRSRTKASFVERHEGQKRLVNPLLACDAADGLLNNPELVSFRDKLDKQLRSGLGMRHAPSVSVYFRELNDGLWFSIGEEEKFVPASLRKVPLMIALLKQAENAPQTRLLDRSVKYDLANDYNLKQTIKPAKALVPGNLYTVRELITRMIVYSDNNAFTLLTKIVDPVEFDRVYPVLRLLDPNAAADDVFLSVQTYESFFRVLYNASYLSREGSEWALALLSRSDFKAGLVAGVPTSVTVAHKFGEHADVADGTVQLHDCGIVYYPNNPYLLCVMSKGSDFELLDDAIVTISRLVYAEVDRQNRNK